MNERKIIRGTCRIGQAAVDTTGACHHVDDSFRTPVAGLGTNAQRCRAWENCGEGRPGAEQKAKAQEIDYCSDCLHRVFSSVARMRLGLEYEDYSDGLSYLRCQHLFRTSYSIGF